MYETNPELTEEQVDMSMEIVKKMSLTLNILGIRFDCQLVFRINYIPDFRA
ncbi:MAG: hypothetical protein U5K51_07940 [Flavobacteriaceae bacterium]|nr:hypothetical protein [Flavobacteriaceae bacterium]